MREMMRLFIVIVIFSAVSGGLLAFLHHGMAQRIETQELTYVRGPAIHLVMEGSSNDPLVDRFKLSLENREIYFYVGIFEGKPKIVALESFGKGYDGDIGVIVGFDVEKDNIIGIGITTNTETPGVGKRIETDKDFQSQFNGLPVKTDYKIRPDGGEIDAISGASFSSRGVVQALNTAVKIYEKLKPEILKNLKGFEA